MTDTPPRYYMGDAPKECNICAAPIRKEFVDGATTLGCWADMCPQCHKVYGRGLGTGRGQQYTKQAVDGRFMKTGG